MTDVTDIADELAQQIPDNRDYVTFQIPASQRDAVVARLRAAAPALGPCTQAELDAAAFDSKQSRLIAMWMERALRAEAATPAVGGEREALAEAGLRHAEGLTAQLNRKDWKPSRAHIEQARNSIKRLADLVLAAQPASPLRGRDVDALTDFICETQDRLGPGCDERAIAQAILRVFCIRDPAASPEQRAAGCGDPNCKDPDCTYGKGPNRQPMDGKTKA